MASAASFTCSWYFTSSWAADRVQRLGDGGDLGQDVDAVLVLLHHPRDSPHLAFDAAEPAQVGILVRGIAVLRR